MADDALDSLAKAASRLRTARSVEEVAGIAAEAARDAIGAHQSGVSLSDSGHTLHRTSFSEKYTGWHGRETAPLHPQLHHRVLAGSGCVRLAAAELAAFVGAEGPPLHGWLAAPLTDSEGGSVGLIHLSEKDGGDFAPGDEAILAQVAALASFALENLRLRASVAAEPPPSATGQGGKSRFRLLFENNPTPMWVYDQETLAFLEVNEAAQRHYGYTRAEFLAMRITDIRPPEDTPRLLELIKDRPSGLRYVGTWRHHLKDGRLIDVDVGSSALEFSGRRAVLVVARDITQQAQAEAALRATEARFMAIVQNAPFVTYIKGIDGGYLFYNREAERVFHMTRTQYLGKTIGDILDAESAAIVEAADRKVLETGEPSVTEMRLPSSVEYEWILLVKFPIRDEAGKIVAIGGFDIDLSKQKRTDLALQESEARREATEQRSRHIVELIHEGIWVHKDGTILFANPAAARLFGAPDPEALIGRSIFSLLHPDDRVRALERTRRVAEERKPLEIVEARLLGLDGRMRIAELQAVPFMEGDDLHIIASGRDVTAHRQAEAQLHQAQKMEAVGQLTGGVAHDFNNLLTVIIGSLDLDPQRVPADLRPALEQALSAAHRGASLTHRLLAFSRRQTLLAERLDFNALARGIEDMLGRTLGEDVELRMKLRDDIWPAVADKGQLESALLNLAINARDAMPEGGKLTIETDNVHLDEDYATRNPDVAPGDYVMLAITDTGTGMPASVVERAFEPFFTTKDVGKGTGLGLSMVYGFVKQSRGHVKIYSEVGHGTTIRLYLPRSSAPAMALGPTPPAQARTRGGETILVVEDDAQVREFVQRQLRDLGYRVIEALDGPQALGILDRGDPIDLLFTDVVMPGGMTGRQLAEEAKRRRPSLRTLFTSGYTEDSILRLGKMDPGVRLLSKPYRRQELAAKVREALDG